MKKTTKEILTSLVGYMLVVAIDAKAVFMEFRPLNQNVTLDLDRFLNFILLKTSNCGSRT